MAVKVNSIKVIVIIQCLFEKVRLKVTVYIVLLLLVDGSRYILAARTISLAMAYTMTSLINILVVFYRFRWIGRLARVAVRVTGVEFTFVLRANIFWVTFIW